MKFITTYISVFLSLQHIEHAKLLPLYLSWHVLRFHLIKVNIRHTTAQQKKNLTCTIIFSCLIFLALAIDTFERFPVGGPTLCVDLACEQLDFEDDAL